MLFAPDTEVALRTVVNLVNSAANGSEGLATQADLDRFLAAEGFSGSRTRDGDELESVHRLRHELSELWTADEDAAVETVNRLLREARALPQLVKHDDWDWHLHATTPEAPLVYRMSTEAAMALADVIRGKEMDGCGPARRRIVMLPSSTSAGTGRSATAIPATAPTARTSPPTGRGRRPPASGCPGCPCRRPAGPAGPELRRSRGTASGLN